MAVALDAISDSGAAASGDLSWSHAGGTPTAVGVSIIWRDASGSPPAVSSVTYGGVALAQKVTETSVFAVRTAIWGVASGSLPTGTQTIVVHFASDPNRWYAAFATTVTGSDTTTMESSTVSATANTNVFGHDVNSPSGELAIDCACEEGAAALVDTGAQTPMGASAALNGAAGRAGYEVGVGASTNFEWTTVGTNDWSWCGLSFKAAAGGGGSVGHRVIGGWGGRVIGD